MRGSGAQVRKKKNVPKHKGKELTIDRTNVTKAKKCDNGNRLETCICKLNRNSSVDPKKHASTKRCIYPEGK